KGMLLVVDVDNARHREHWHARRARSRQLSWARASACSALVGENHIAVALDLDRNGHLSGRAILPKERADQDWLRIRLALLDLGEVKDDQAVGGFHGGIGVAGRSAV